MISSDEVLRELIAEGVSPWLDGLGRSLITSEFLDRLVAGGGIRGATTDITALADDMATGSAYHQQLSHLAHRSVPTDTALLALCAYDLRLACDALMPVHTATRGFDGQVSMDIDPALSHDAAATVAAAERLFESACRPNALVKIPATDEGLVAIGHCLAKGISVHVTQIFSVRRYDEVVHTWFDGLERALAAGVDLTGISSLASLPVGRIDTEVDARLDDLDAPGAAALRGTAALATARLVFRLYEESLGCRRWRALTAAHARPQRLMWNISAFPPAPAPESGTAAGAHYLRELVAWGTVTAMSADTLRAAAGQCPLEGDTLSDEHRAAGAVVDRLEQIGVSFDGVAKKLEAESMDHLVTSWRNLRSTVEERLRAPRGRS
ncbi:transaldolase family protein [Streptomyces sp. NPDC049577]|uniref:transaldolase family protein n=1 Tax=Streptomyces sp. NPDC049577 TaxID=3155153 RepID=UPI00344A78EC